VVTGPRADKTFPGANSFPWCHASKLAASKGKPIMKKASIAVLAALLSLGAANIALADPHPGDDTNRYENKSTGG
jgi:hypothetical protein